MSSQYKKNMYICDDCETVYITIDRDQGITPFLMSCKTNKCEGMAQSSLYRVNQNIVPDHEWYYPDKEEYIKQGPSTKQHIDKGGLLLRKIETQPCIKQLEEKYGES